MKSFIRSVVLTACLVHPALLLASEGGEHAAVPHGIPNQVWFHLVNFIILAFILVRVIRRPLAEFLARRQDGIRDQLERSESARREAEQRANELEQRFQGLSAELESLRTQTLSEARDEALKVIAGANAAAEQLKSDAQRLLDTELLAARARMRREVVELAVNLAQRLVKENIQDADQVRLAQAYVSTMAQTTEIH